MTIKLPARLSARVARLARARHTSRSEVVRQAIEALPIEERETVVERFAHLLGAARGLPRDLSTNKRYLRGFGE
jgi:predicted transcriptional regulator